MSFVAIRKNIFMNHVLRLEEKKENITLKSH